MRQYPLVREFLLIHLHRVFLRHVLKWRLFLHVRRLRCRLERVLLAIILLINIFYFGKIYMLYNLPEELQWYIWKTYYNKYVLSNLSIKINNINATLIQKGIISKIM